MTGVAALPGLDTLKASVEQSPRAEPAREC